MTHFGETVKGPKKNLTFNQWWTMLKRVLKRQYDFESDDQEAWRGYYDAGDSPIDAAHEDASYGDHE